MMLLSHAFFRGDKTQPAIIQLAIKPCLGLDARSLRARLIKADCRPTTSSGAKYGDAADDMRVSRPVSTVSFKSLSALGTFSHSRTVPRGSPVW